MKMIDFDMPRDKEEGLKRWRPVAAARDFPHVLKFNTGMVRLSKVRTKVVEYTRRVFSETYLERHYLHLDCATYPDRFEKVSHLQTG